MRSLLTPREWEVLKLVGQGLTNKDIGRRLGITEGTVKLHMRGLFDKLETRTRYQLIIMVAKHE